MKRVFISQPFSGKTESDVMEQRNEITKKIINLIHETPYVFDQYHQDPPPKEIKCNNVRIWYLGHSITLMSLADLVVFSKDYETATGCKAEMEIGQMYGLNIMMEEDL